MANKIISFHGGGGNGGPGGYGAGANHPSGSWFTTIAPTGLSDAAYSTIKTYLQGQIAVGDNIICTGFSLGNLALHKILANCVIDASMWQNTLRGVVFDDPAADLSVTFPTQAASGVRRALWCAQWSGAGAPANDWTVETLGGGGGFGAISSLAQRLGVTAQLNPYVNYHAPLTIGVAHGYPEVAQSSTWWTPLTNNPPPTGTNKIRVLLTMHGGGGGLGPNNFGSGCDHPRGDFVTVECTHLGGSVRIDGTTYSGLPTLPQGWRYNSRGYTEQIAYLNAAIDKAIQVKNAQSAEVIAQAFSYGGGALAHMADRGETLGGRLIGYNICDPGEYPAPLYDPPNGQSPGEGLPGDTSIIPFGDVDTTRFRKLYYISGGPTDSYSDDMATLLGITRTANTVTGYTNTVHHPYTRDVNNSNTPTHPPEEDTGTAVSWWGKLNTDPVTPPPTGDQTTYQAESGVLFNRVADGARIATDSPGYTGPGYIGYWWQPSEGVRWTSVTGGTSTGNRTLRFHYRCAEPGGSAQRRLRVNGVDRGLVNFPTNANAWTEANFSDVVLTNIPMNAGTVNTVELQIESPGGVDLDYMMVDATGGTTTTPASGVQTLPEGATFNVKTGYGALGNGVANDTTAIQNALTAASAAGTAGAVSVVYFPAGTYLITTALQYGSNVILRGAGLSTIIKNSRSRSDIGFTTMLQPVSGASRSNIIVEKITWHQEGQFFDAAWGSASANALCISANWTTNMVVQDCRFEDIRTMCIWTDSAGSAQPTNNHKVLRNYVARAEGDAFSYFGQIYDAIVQDNEIHDTADECIAFQATSVSAYPSRVRVHGNIIRDCVRRARLPGGELATVNGINIHGSDNAVVENNDIRNVFGSCIRSGFGARKSTDVIIKGNYCAGAGSAGGTAQVPAYGIWLIGNDGCYGYNHSFGTNGAGNIGAYQQPGFEDVDTSGFPPVYPGTPPTNPTNTAPAAITGTVTPPPVTPSAAPPRVIAGEAIGPADSLWYADISTLPVLSDSATRLNGNKSDPTYRSEWGPAGYTDQVTCDFGSGQQFNQALQKNTPFGFPLTIVEANQQPVPISSIMYPSESDVSTASGWPVPLTAQQEHNSDYHVTALQKGTHKLYEAWLANPVGGAWTLGAEATWTLTSYAMRPADWTSGDGAGLPILPFSVSDDEVVDLGEINHMLRICMTYLENGYVYPANHNMDPTNARTPRVKAGHILRLKASVNPATRGLGPQATIIANALKKHGAVVCDIGPNLKINGLSGPRWNNNDLNTIRGLHFDDFELVDVSSLRVSTSDRNLWFKINQNTTTPPPAVGTPIAITGRPNQFAVKVDNASFRTQAQQNIITELQTGWDGVLITDAFAEPGQGIEQNTAYDTAAEVQAVTQGALSQILAAVKSAGYIALASVDDVADYAALSDTWEAYGTGIEDPEFIRDSTGTVKGTSVEAQQAANVPVTGADAQNLFTKFNINRTTWASKAAAIHALATYLCFTEGAAVLAINADSGLNDAPLYSEEFLYDYGTETAARTTPFTNVYLRKFSNGAAVANLSGTQQTVTLGATYYDFTSTTGMTSVVVPAQSGVVLRTTPVSTPPPNPSGSTGTLQAEAGVLSAVVAAAVSSASPGYNGTGYIGNWWQLNEAWTGTISVPSAGNYDLTFRYRCAEPDGSADRTLQINGGSGVTVNFPANTTAWSNNAWATVTRTTVALTSGSNTIKLTCPSSSGNGLDFDEMTWKPTGTTSPPNPGTGTGFFVFSGNELRDPDDRRVAILGLNGSHQHFPSPTQQFIQNMPVTNPPLPGNARSTFTGQSAGIQTWGVNFIRSTTALGAAGGIGAQLPRYLALIDEYTAKKICVTICNLPTQDATNNPSFSDPLVQEALEMWRQILAARPNNPYIWIDCGGEIEKQGNTTYWSSYYTSWYNAIRGFPGGANNMIMCTAPGGGQNPQLITPSIWSTFASGKHHICLDWHMYCVSFQGETVAQSMTKQLGYLNTIRTNNIPLVIMEHGYQATPKDGPPAGFNPGACCAADNGGIGYQIQRANCLRLIDDWVPNLHINAVWWIGTSDDDTTSGHSLRYSPPNNGTFLDWNMPFSEYGQKFWNIGQQSRFW
jgi:hypothetical protein